MTDLVKNCIYCGSSNLSRTHIFAKHIGGMAKPLLTCHKCNRAFSEIEDDLLKNVFVANAVRKLGIWSADKAFGKAQPTLRLPSGEFDYLFDADGNLIPKLKKQDDHSVVGGSDDIKRIILGKHKKGKLNDEEYKRLSQFLESDVFGARYEKGISVEKIPIQHPQFEYRGLTSNMPPIYLAKIVYEHLALFGLHDLSVAQQFRQSYLSSTEVSSGNVSKKLNQQVVAIGAIHSPMDHSKVSYCGHFYVYLGVGEEGLLYAAVCLYGVMRYVVTIGFCLDGIARLDLVKRILTLYFVDDSRVGYCDVPPMLCELPIQQLNALALGVYIASLKRP